MPAATPAHLVVAMGKDGNAYLLDRDNLGGVTVPVASLHVSNNVIIQAAATYRTNQGTYVAFRGNGNTISTVRINSGSSADHHDFLELEPEWLRIAFCHID